MAALVLFAVVGVGSGQRGVLSDRDVQLYCWQVLVSLVSVVQFGPGFPYMVRRKQVDQSSEGEQFSGDVRFQFVRLAVSCSLV